jgi:methionine sulfoxide reductase catalytic subunit
MLIRREKPEKTPEREVTPESIYLGRRRLLQAATTGLGGLTTTLRAALGARAKPPAEAPRALEAPRNTKFKVEGREISPESITAGFNNYYEFTVDKRRVAELAEHFTSRPWQIEVRGLVEKPLKFDVDDLLKRFPLEERVYRMRCVEAWSIVVPWAGFPMAKFIEWAKPTAKAKYVRMVSFLRPEQAVGQRQQAWYPWPYFEALRLGEAMNEVAFLVVGSYGQILPNQNGSPLRLAVPWKYGYKSIKAITRFEFTDKQPPTFWNTLVPNEYDFTSNVNPAKPHPRWSQASEEDVPSRQRIPTLPYNGYGQYVAHLYG